MLIDSVVPQVYAFFLLSSLLCAFKNGTRVRTKGDLRMNKNADQFYELCINTCGWFLFILYILCLDTKYNIYKYICYVYRLFMLTGAVASFKVANVCIMSVGYVKYPYNKCYNQRFIREVDFVSLPFF